MSFWNRYSRECVCSCMYDYKRKLMLFNMCEVICCYLCCRRSFVTGCREFWSNCCTYDGFKIKFKHRNECFLCVIDTFSLLFAHIMKNRQNVKWICWQLCYLWEDLVFFVFIFLNKIIWCCVMFWQIMSSPTLVFKFFE